MKKLSVTNDRVKYKRNIVRVNSKEERYLKVKPLSTVKLALGTPSQFMGLLKINTIGIQQANKLMPEQCGVCFWCLPLLKPYIAKLEEV